MDARPNELKQIYNIQKLYIAFELFAFSMLLVHFKRHFSFEEIIAGYAVLFFTPLPFIFLIRKIRTTAFLVTAFVTRGLCLVIYLIRPALPVMLAYYFVNGLVIFYFWVPYNIRYFLLSHRTNRATQAGHLIVVGPILNTFVPLASGLAIAKLGPPWQIGASAALAVVLVYQASRLPGLDITYDFRAVLRQSRGLRFLKFIQGVWEAGNMALPIYGLLFLHGELAFGTYLSYLGLVGVVGALIISRFSDRQARRLKYFFPFVTALAVLTISLSWAQSLGRWTVLSGLVGIASTMTYPFLFAVVLDKVEDRAAGMIAREFMLNAGRVVGYLVMLALVALTGTMRWWFLFTGSTLLVYPVLLVLKKIYIEEDYHPLLHITRIYAESKSLISAVYTSGRARSGR
jgi:hypothetical protein